jgi:large subunit ribosomal protein L25
VKKHTLSAEKRDLVGRKVKALRIKGEIPGTVYGKDVKSLSVTVSKDAFIKVYGAAGETGLVELSVGGDTRPVLIHTVQKDPVKGTILHVEFYQVNLKQKVKTNVPLEFTGEAPAVTQKTGVLLTLIDEIEVEALPTDLPEKIFVDVSKLAEVDQEAKVKDLSIPEGVTVLTAADQSVVRVGALISKEAEAQAAAEAAAAAAAAAEAAAVAPAQEAVPAAAPTGEAPAEAQKAPEAAKPPAEK